MTGVLVVEDGGSPYVLAAVRSLGRAGFRVGVASPVPNPRLMPSRWTSRWHATRLPERDHDGFLADVGDAVRAGAYDIVFGADDIELLALSAARDVLPALFPHAPHAAVLRAVDKLTLSDAAREVGVAVPWTAVADEAALDQVSGPVVVKARLHWTPGAPAEADRHLLVQLCDDAVSARARVRELEAVGAGAALQEPIDGEQIALSVVVDGAGAVHAVSQQRTVLSSLSRTSVRAVTTAVEEPLVDGAVRLLRALGWTGLANLQYLRPPGGAAHLIDLNGRFYGSLALAVGAGADLPAVWARLSLGEPAPARQVARAGVRFHALQTDLARARVQRRGGVLADVLGVVRYAPGAVHSTWSLRDPRPAGHIVGSALRRRLPSVSAAGA